MNTAYSFLISKIFLFSLIGTAPFFTGCEKDPSFSLSTDNAQFKIIQPTKQFSKIDILWVIDNSRSMATTQKNLAKHFTSFIKNFSKQDFDFQLGVISTDGFRNNPKYSKTVKKSNARLRDGAGGEFSSGVHIITPTTPNLEETFITNIKLGTTGYYDERAFSSIESAFNEPFNQSFFREDSFTAIIIVSDEDDFSYDGTINFQTIDNPLAELYPVSKFTDFLDIQTNSDNLNRAYNVSAIHIKPGDTGCLDQINRGEQIFGQRYEKIANDTGGRSISLCDDFSESLNLLSSSIIDASQRDTFYIPRRPIINTINVKVDGQVILESINGSSGWTYLATDDDRYAIQFSEDSRPTHGSFIDITYDPYDFD